MNKCEMNQWIATSAVANEVRRERARQDERWGEQNHPDGTDSGWFRTAVADDMRNRADEAVRDGELTWRHILQEEVAEAFAERDPEKLRAELIQVAAVACAWVESIDRRCSAGRENV